MTFPKMRALDTSRLMVRARFVSIALPTLLGAWLLGTGLHSTALLEDAGAAGAWQQLLKLTTTASVLHTTAHPDDEHGGLLAMLGRKQGVRVGLLTLNRGEGGDNAIGPELFDALGLIRTEELLVAGRYYGVDDQYFTTVVDYGFSKRLDEALEKWGREHVLRDMVRVIRMNRPLVIVSRFQGNDRDGHGNHQAAGLLTREAYEAAADPTAFPEQVAEGLRPWPALKLYVGGVQEGENWSVRLNTGEYSPWLGDSYANFGRLGLSFQRSQVSGRFRRVVGASYSYYRRIDSKVPASDQEGDLFDGIDTTLAGLFGLFRKTAPEGVETALATIDAAVEKAMKTFSPTDPSASVPALVEGLQATRAALRAAAAEPDARFILEIKEAQFMQAINAALGLDFTAMAQPAGIPESTASSAPFTPQPTMPPVVPGQRFDVLTTLTNRGRLSISPTEITLTTAPGWNVTNGPAKLGSLGMNETASQGLSVRLSDDAAITSRPYFSRESIAESRYTISEREQFGRPAGAPAAIALARYTVNGVAVEAHDVVRRREANLPYGDELRELQVVPPLALTVSPTNAIIPVAAPKKEIPLQVELLNNVEGRSAGELSLILPAGWSSRPSAMPFAFSSAGERAVYRFTVFADSIDDREYEVQAVARTNGGEYRDGYETVAQRDLETRYLYRPATSHVRGVDVDVAPGLSVGYVMGVGDQVPAAIAQLGARVTLLDAEELSTGDLSRFDAIMTGTRAYAVREDLRTHNQRLLDYVREGGNLIVLYNTQEFVPEKWAPFPAALPREAEEVSEEDSPVEILAADHQVFTWPNRITNDDFDGWVEQRGSKFFTTWDPAYTPMIAAHDQGQDPQRGGWVWARHGRGHYTYFAYAFHRQLPYGVPGAYRLLANLLALSQPSPPFRAASARQAREGCLAEAREACGGGDHREGILITRSAERRADRQWQHAVPERSLRPTRPAAARPGRRETRLDRAHEHRRADSRRWWRRASRPTDRRALPLPRAASPG
ncbi:MAG: PIG-L family deacetylase [Luteitalea sp.]|nr:PIG-L family deacetylase [Luteitalea sp.]